MRKIRYNCAMSLDGYIAGPDDEFDWIVMDPQFDFKALSEEFDTYLLGRRTFEVTEGEGLPSSPGVRTYVFSRTLSQEEFGNVTVVGEDWKETVRSLRAEPGKDIWLFGGGSLFRSLAEEGLVDTVEVTVVPVILGQGVPLVAKPAPRITLTLRGQKVYPKTGTVTLVYEVNHASTRNATL